MRGDELHPSMQLLTVHWELFPISSNYIDPTDVRGCSDPRRRSVSMPRLGPLGAPRSNRRLGYQGVIWEAGPHRAFRDNGVAEWPGIKKLQIVMEEANEDQELEQEEVMFTPKDHNINEECLEGLEGLDVQVIEKVEENDLLKSLQVVPLKEIEYVHIRGIEQGIGFDVRSTRDVIIPLGERQLVPLGIMCQCP